MAPDLCMKGRFCCCGCCTCCTIKSPNPSKAPALLVSGLWPWNQGVRQAGFCSCLPSPGSRELLLGLVQQLPHVRIIMAKTPWGSHSIFFPLSLWQSQNDYCSFQGIILIPGMEKQKEEESKYLLLPIKKSRSFPPRSTSKCVLTSPHKNGDDNGNLSTPDACHMD